MLADVVAMCRDQVTIAPFASEDADGTPAYGAGVAYRSRVVLGPVRVVDARGQEVVAVATVYLARKVAVGTKDQLTLPGGIVSPILRVGDSPDELGQSSTVVYVGAAG